MKFYGELLIFVLLFVTNIRVFFVDSAKKDPLAALAPITFILSILQVAAWGFGIFTILGVIISFLVLLSNFHALFRYSENLYIDHYSPLMMVWAIFTSVLSISAIVVLLIFTPIELSNRKLGIIENVSKYTGDFKTGFEPAGNLNKITATLYEYELEPESVIVENKENKSRSVVKEVVDKNKEDNLNIDDREENIVLFVPDKRGNTYYYKPFLQLLAKEGYTVCSADFYSKDCKWFYSILDLKIFRRMAMVIKSRKDIRTFNSQREFYTYNISLECKALINMIKEKYGKNCKIFLISDGMSDTAVSDIVKINKTNITGSFSLSSVPEFKTSGYGCVAQTAPVLNKSMGFSRERKLETPKLLVEKAKENIKF